VRDGDGTAKDRRDRLGDATAVAEDETRWLSHPQEKLK
jgi:hypothetical protein